MKRVLLVLAIGAASWTGMQGVVAHAAVWMVGYDPQHTNVCPGEFTPPAALQWKFSTEEALSERSATRPTVGVGAGQPLGPAAGGQWPGAMGGGGMMQAGPGVGGGPAGFGEAGRTAPRTGVASSTLPKPVASPVVGPDRAFFVVDQTVYCVDRVTGAQLWKRPVGARVFSSPIYVDNYVYVGGDDGRVHAIRAQDGSVEWVYRLDKGVRSAFTYANGCLFFGCEDERVYCLDLKARDLRWVYSTGKPVRAAPSVWQETVFVVSRDGYLYALNLKGEQRWRVHLGEEECYAPPVVAGEMVYVAAGPHVFAFDAKLGHRRWQETFPADITGALAVSPNAVFLGNQEGAIYCLDAATGRARWRYPKEGALQPVQAGLVVAGGVVLARAGVTSVVALHTGTGQLIWRYTLPPAPYRAFRDPEVIAARWGQQTGYGGFGEAGQLGPQGAGTRRRTGGPGGAQRGQFGQQPGQWTRQRLQEEEIPMEELVDPSPALWENRLYILGDDCVLYGFEVNTPDNLGPTIADAVLEITGEQELRFAYYVPVDEIDQFPLRFADLVKVPGTPPVYLSVRVVDYGCGIDPASIQMSMDNQRLDIVYDADEGLAWFMHGAEGRAATALSEGKHNVVIRAADWLGNQAAAQLSFTIDNSLPPPSAGGWRPATGGQQGPGGAGGFGVPGPWGGPGGGGPMGPWGPGGGMLMGPGGQ
ncbi:MAG: PQQ-binding-like beta-propeller repeat protein [Armatimonadetes bacterium]|nr:PQQ-binding-like beta-propeller repeat protein [Armatimonadota bacterium]